MIYGIIRNAKRYLVVDDHTNSKLLSDLAKLNITPLTFSWINKRPVFGDLEYLKD